jgi:hypothetical protein
MPISQYQFYRVLQAIVEFFSLFYASLVPSFKYGSDFDGILFKRLKLSNQVYIKNE